jgi:hypothetical protein
MSLCRSCITFIEFIGKSEIQLFCLFEIFNQFVLVRKSESKQTTLFRQIIIKLKHFYLICPINRPNNETKKQKKKKKKSLMKSANMDSVVVEKGRNQGKTRMSVNVEKGQGVHKGLYEQRERERG